MKIIIAEDPNFGKNEQVYTRFWLSEEISIYIKDLNFIHIKFTSAARPFQKEKLNSFSLNLRLLHSSWLIYCIFHTHKPHNKLELVSLLN